MAGWTNALLLSLVVGGAVISFLPLFTEEISHLDTASTNATSVRALPTYMGFVYAALAIASVFMLDLVFDVAAKVLSTTHVAAATKKEWRGADAAILNDAEKFLFAAGLAVLPFVTLCVQSNSSGSGGEVYVLTLACAIRCQVVLFTGTIVTSLARYNPRRFPPWLAGLCVVAVGGVGGLSGYVANRTASADTTTTTATAPLSTARTACAYISGIILAALCLVWLASVAATTAVAAWKRRAIWWSRQVEPGKFADNTLEDVPASTDDRYLGYRALYLVAVVAWMAVKVGINWAYPNVDDRYTIPAVTSLSPIPLTPHCARSSSPYRQVQRRGVGDGPRAVRHLRSGCLRRRHASTEKRSCAYFVSNGCSQKAFYALHQVLSSLSSLFPISRSAFGAYTVLPPHRVCFAATSCGRLSARRPADCNCCRPTWRTARIPTALICWTW